MASFLTGRGSTCSFKEKAGILADVRRDDQSFITTPIQPPICYRSKKKQLLARI